MSNPADTPTNRGAAESVSERLRRVRQSIPGGIELVAVSKFHPAEAVAEAYDAGQRLFGESRAAELKEKAAALPADIQWHFIGHLQTNKVRQVVASCHTIQSIDSLRLLEAVAAEARRQDRTVEVLLQVHVAREESKFGFLPDELPALVPALKEAAGESVVIAGVMGMATNTDDEATVASDFRRIRTLFDTLRSGPFAGDARFRTVSMGMSGDRAVAIACGSTMVRVGTDIFGERV
ncbi:MAG: YggS family pyridoxal phosphate-dependent enzyme [Clostridium sp.]|nr:YggS family pyridoxal phosphate-dependent enzyme [Clostridium sp.]